MGTPATESDWPGTEFGFDTSDLSIYWPCNASSWVMKCLQKLPLYDRCHPMSTSTKSAVASCLFHRYSVWMCWEEAFHSFSPLIHGWIWPKMWVWSPREQMAFLALIIPSRIFIVSTPPKKPWWNVGDLCGTIEWCCNYRGWDKKNSSAAVPESKILGDVTMMFVFCNFIWGGESFASTFSESFCYM